HDFFQTQYVPLADDFWVLGETLPAGGGVFQVVHPGRYWISSTKDPGTGIDIFAPKTNSAPPINLQFPVTVDGFSLSGQAIELTAGSHELHTTTNSSATIRWLGPRLVSL